MTLLTTTSSLVGCWKGDATTSAFLCLKVVLSKGGWQHNSFCAIQNGFQSIQRKEHCWMSLSWILSILPKLLSSVHGYDWLYRLLSWLYFSLGQILYLRLPYQGWTLLDGHESFVRINWWHIFWFFWGF